MTISAPVVPVVVNVRAEAVSDPALIRATAGGAGDKLGPLARDRCCWMEAAGVTEFWEIGAGKALSGMIKRIAASAVTRAVGTPEDVAAAKG